MNARPWRRVAEGIALRVRLTPKASRDRLDGIAELADGSVVVRAAVTAPPEGGKANAALLRLLAKSWRLPRTALAVTAGAGSRLKTVTLRGDAKTLTELLERWRAAARTGGKETT